LSHIHPKYLVITMPTSPIIVYNQYGGMYEVGVPFSPTRWTFIAQCYERELVENGVCSYRCLANVASILVPSAKKAVIYYESGTIIPPKMDRGLGEVV